MVRHNLIGEENDSRWWDSEFFTHLTISQATLYVKSITVAGSVGSVFWVNWQDIGAVHETEIGTSVEHVEINRSVEGQDFTEGFIEF